MLFEQANTEIDPLEAQFAEGAFAPILDWLREKVHQPGNRYRAAELMQNITGSSIDHAPLI